MMIFDEFPTRQAAQDFAKHIQSKYKRQTWICDSQVESDEIDPFPFGLNPPIVLVDRLEDYSGQDQIVRAVHSFQGRFAGT